MLYGFKSLDFREQVYDFQKIFWTLKLKRTKHYFLSELQMRMFGFICSEKSWYNFHENGTIKAEKQNIFPHDSLLGHKDFLIGNINYFKEKWK